MTGPGHLPLLGDTLPLFYSLSPEETISPSSYTLSAFSLVVSCAVSRVYISVEWGGAGRNSSTPSCSDPKSLYFILRKEKTQLKQIIHIIFSVSRFPSAIGKGQHSFALLVLPLFLLSSSFFFHSPPPLTCPPFNPLIYGGIILE